uniref:Uncharacterized protein n=1 Tax=viral metagenome TaxID=1070528 RepID=A0A6C0B9Z6_9ZZZZ
MTNVRPANPLCPCKKPDLILYQIRKNGEKYKLSPNKFLYSGEGIFVDNFKNNKQKGSYSFSGTQYTSIEEPKTDYSNEQLILAFSDGSTITSLFSDINKTNPNGIFLPGKVNIVKIICGTGKYTFKEGYIAIKVIDETKRKCYVYFTK